MLGNVFRLHSLLTLPHRVYVDYPSITLYNFSYVAVLGILKSLYFPCDAVLEAAVAGCRKVLFYLEGVSDFIDLRSFIN